MRRNAARAPQVAVTMIYGCSLHVLRSTRVALATHQRSCRLAPTPVRDQADAISAVTQTGMGLDLLRSFLARVEREPTQAAMPAAYGGGAGPPSPVVPPLTTPDGPPSPLSAGERAASASAAWPRRLRFRRLAARPA